MNYLPLHEQENNQGNAMIGHILWPGIVFLGLILTGALDTLRF